MSKKKSKPTKINNIKAQYIIPADSFGKFRMITIYENFSIAIGAAQKLEDHNFIRMHVGDK